MPEGCRPCYYCTRTFTASELRDNLKLNVNRNQSQRPRGFAAARAIGTGPTAGAATNQLEIGDIDV